MASRSGMRKIRAQIRRSNRQLSETGADPSRADWALWGELAIALFASETGRPGEIHSDPETVLSDLLADLMHWCDAGRSDPELHEEIRFDSALERARDYYSEEVSDELEQGGRTRE